MHTDAHALEYAIMAVYLVVVFGFALYYGRRLGREDTAGYFLAGRALPWYLIGFSFYASNMSGASFVGLIGASYSEGLAVFHYEWTAALVLVLFAAFIIPVFLRNRIATVPEYLELRFDRRTRLLYALFTLVTLLFIDMAGALYAGAIVMQTGVPGLDLWTACIVISLLVGAYTIFGGLRAVVITDAIQALVLIAGALAVALYGLYAVGGWEALTARMEASHLNVFRPVDDPFLPWPGIAGVVILGLYYWTFNQYFVQRALGAESLEAGRKGALFAGLLKLPNLLLMIVPGMVAVALYPALDSPDKAFPTLAFELLPVGLRGIVLAAMLAAIMSSLDSALNAASSLVTLDLVKPRWPYLSDRRLLGIGRIVTGAFMVMAALYAPLIASFGSLFTYFQSTLAYLVPPIVAIYLAGLLSRRLSRGSAFWTLVIIVPLAILAFLSKEVSGLWSGAGLPDLHFTYMAVIICALTLVLLHLITALTAAGAEVDRAATATRADLRPEHRGRLLADYRVAAVLLMLATAVTLAALAML
ncbi:SLC5 family protein [Dichotomicrobium thermohalophilum]|uniref:SSS family solute:Na+ symporter n=1 Tax=Dichotomicrobium thermohalophilum TaxID=933063 RepID=A0A397PH70_9HYPH|nr:sodium/solute symporter [Dichotomicrobium thermohalophilum]RIA45474.1 SSS family solute:Na+ symporter [Dichotomicrobium thermohalophilum]